MSRFLLLLFLVCVAACGGRRSAPPVAPAVSPARAHAGRHQEPATASRTVSTPEQALVLPPAPALDTLVPPEELAAELRLAADSAADEAVLEELDDARPADDDADEPLPATPVTWDIDVDTYHDHDRVQ